MSIKNLKYLKNSYLYNVIYCWFGVPSFFNTFNLVLVFKMTKYSYRVKDLNRLPSNRYPRTQNIRLFFWKYVRLGNLYYHIFIVRIIKTVRSRHFVFPTPNDCNTSVKYCSRGDLNGFQTCRKPWRFLKRKKNKNTVKPTRIQSCVQCKNFIFLNST